MENASVVGMRPAIEENRIIDKWKKKIEKYRMNAMDGAREDIRRDLGIGERGKESGNSYIVRQFTRNPWRPSCHHFKHTINVLLPLFVWEAFTICHCAFWSTTNTSQLTRNIESVCFWPALYLHNDTRSTSSLSLQLNFFVVVLYSKHIFSYFTSTTSTENNKNLISLTDFVCLLALLILHLLSGDGDEHEMFSCKNVLPLICIMRCDYFIGIYLCLL